MYGRVSYKSIIHPEDADRVAQEVRDHSEGRQDEFSQEHRIIDGNGSVNRERSLSVYTCPHTVTIRLGEQRRRR